VVLSLLDILPGKGFTYETTPNQMALWELVMLILPVLTTIVKGDLIKRNQSKGVTRSYSPPASGGEYDLVTPLNDRFRPYP
jgi:hypothetical protein